MSRLFGRIALIAATAAVFSSATLAAVPMRQTVDLDRIPAWVVQVAARPVPQTDADAAILHQELIVEPLPEGGFRTTRRLAVKILLMSASREFATQSAVYRKSDPRPDMETWVLYGDGKAVLPDRVEDRVDMPYVASGYDYEDARVSVLATPAPIPGAVVVFESVVVDSIDIGGDGLELGELHRPTALARLELRLPSGWAGDGAVLGATNIAVQKNAGSIVIEAKDLPAQPRHTGIDLEAERVLPSAWVHWWNPGAKRGFSDWNAVGRYIEDLSAPRLADAGGAQAAGAAIKPSGDAAFLSSLERAFAIAGREVRYAAVRIGIGGYQPASVAATFKDKFGDCKAKATLLRALLKSWGAETYPVLVRTRDLGRLPEEAPSLALFNHFITAVRLPAGVGTDLWAAREIEGVGRLLFVDATQPESPYELPDADQATRALLILPMGSRVVDLPTRPAATHTTATTIEATLEPTGRLSTLKIDKTADRGAAMDERGRLRRLSADERTRDLLNDLRHRLGALRLQTDDIRALHDPGQPFGRTITATDAVAGQRVRRLLVLETARLAPAVPHGVLPEELAAPWVLDVGEPRREVVDMTIKAPAGLKLEAMPAPVKYEDGLLAIDAAFTFEGGTLRYHRSLELRTPLVTPEHYAAFRTQLSALRRLETDGVAFFD